MMNAAIYLSLVLCVVCDAASDVEQAFLDYEIVPSVFPVSPTKPINIVYPSEVVVNFGNELTPTQVKDEPTVSWEYEPGVLYTLILAEPDAPTKQDPSDGEVRHWLVVNIPDNSIDDGLTIVAFVGSAPPEGTGIHRYIYFVFKQSARIEYNGPFVVNTTRDGRFFTKAMEFASENNLGSPEFGNFFTAQFDDWVPQLGAILDANSTFKRRRT